MTEPTTYYAVLNDGKIVFFTDDVVQATELFTMGGGDRMEKVTSLADVKRILDTYLSSEESRRHEDPEITVNSDVGNPVDRIWQYLRDDCDELGRRIQNDIGTNEKIDKEIRRKAEEDIESLKKLGADTLERFRKTLKRIGDAFVPEEEENDNETESGKTTGSGSQAE